ncbi:MAG: B12-binding domain-containing radical SAM protein [Planctomycetota bacterium]|jgi:radical SAM superfamily enzyme YgiQ (UPF0313 family)
MKVLLLNSPWINDEKKYGIKSGTRWPALRKKDRSMPYFPFPYLLACAKAILKKEGMDVHIKDAIAEEITQDECMAYVENLKPDLLLVEAFTPSIYIDLSFVKEAKLKTGCFIALCGAHPTSLASDMLKDDFVDFVLLGEYDYTLRELCLFLSQHRKDFDKIKGLAYKENDLIKINPGREVIMDLDEIPIPNRDELPVSKYNEPLSKYYPNARIVTSRGCPYNKCIFCVEPFMYGREYRKRSIRHVFEEIDMLIKKYGVKEIDFDDAIFTIPRAKEIAQEILRIDMKIAWSCWIDWNINLEQLELLKRSGCIAVKFGVESANAQILTSIGKSIYIDNIKRLIKNCQKLGILSHGSFMLGLPGETKKSIKETINLAFSLGLNVCQFSIATPLPGTQFYEMVLKNNWLVTRDWTRFEGVGSCVVEYPDCSREDILNGIEEVGRRKVKQFLRNPVIALGFIWKLYRMKGFRGFYNEILNKGKFVLKSMCHQK